MEQSAPIRITLYDYAYESFSIQYLASTLRKEKFQVEVYYDCSMDKDYLGQDFFLTSFFSLSPEKIARRILATEPDVVGFSLLTVYYPVLSRIIANLKRLKPGLTVIAGGPHCVLTPRSVLENEDIDFIFQGDADISLPDFLRKLSTRPVEELAGLPAEAMPGISNRLPGGGIIDRGLGPVMENLDDVPFPDKSHYYNKNPSLKTLYTITCSRGCIFTCTYCNSYSLRKIYRQHGQRYYRVRSVENVIAELRHAKDRYEPKYVMFLDNLFAARTKWLEEFTAAYKSEIGLPFFCETNPNVHTAETMDLLAEAGCTLLQFGFQSVNEQVRRDILQRRETNEHIRELIRKAKDNRMLVCVDHIANLPGERKEHLSEALEFYHETRPYWVNLGFLQYYPGASIVDIAAAHKTLSREDIEAIHEGRRQTSFRLLKNSHLGNYYRTFPIRLFLSFKASKKLHVLLMPLLENRMVIRLVSPLASLFIYLSRIFAALTNKRDFLVRHHIIRNLYVMKVLFREKFFTNGR